MEPKLKLSHDSEITAIHFTQSSKQIVTSGGDGKITVWDSIEDDDPLQTFKIGGSMRGFAIKGDTFYCPNERGNSLVSYSLSDGQTEGMLTRFTAPITDITSNSTHVAAASSDFKIKTINSEGDTCTLSGHEAPVLSVALAPQSGHVLSASCDGTVRLWTIKTRCCLQTHHILPKISDVSLSVSACRTSWKSDGSQFAVPVGQEVHIYSKKEEKLIHSLTDESIKQPINVCAYQTDGDIIACGTIDGFVVVWDAGSRSRLFSCQLSDSPKVTSISWCSGSEFLVATDKGSFGKCEISGLAESDEKKPTVKSVVDEFNDSFMEGDDNPFMDAEAAEDLGEDDFKDLVEEHEDEVKQARKRNRVQVDDDDDDDDDKNVAENDDKDIDDMMSEMSGVLSSVAPNPTTDTSTRPDVITQALPVQLVTCEQKPFQPGSTPENLKCRYMVWNQIGMVRSYATEDEATIDIEFHDASKHHTIHINNSDDYTMADIGEQCAVLATRDNGHKRSSLLCMQYGSSDARQQWGTTLDKHEEIECVCAGGDFVAVATSSHVLRSFTSGGFQLAPFLIPGRPVAMAGCKDVLMMAYHVAPALNGYQNMAVSILKVTGHREVLTHESRLPLSAQSTLLWLGFSTEGTPMMYDSNGLLSMYRINGDHLWTPVLHTKTIDKNSTHFIIGVAERPPQLRSVICKGSRYPQLAPRPPVGIREFRIPLCSLDTDNGGQEEIIWRSRLLSQAMEFWLSDDVADTDANDKLEQTALLKIFSVACREERMERALQICSLMSHSYMKLAAQYANRTHNVNLAQEISRLADERLAGDEKTTRFVRTEYYAPRQLSDVGHCDDYRGKGEDELTRFTSSRFSTTPNRDLTTSLTSQRSQSQHAQAETISDVGNTVRTSFANALNNADVDDSQSQDLLSVSRSNPFKRSSTGSSKPTTIDSIHKMIDNKAAQKQEQKKMTPTVPTMKVKQTKLFASKPEEKKSPSVPAPCQQSEEEEPKENVEKITTKVTAFDLFYKEKFDSDADSHTQAMESFKTLSKDTKKEYVAKAKSMNSAAPEPSEKKRKLNHPKQPDSLSNKTPALSASENTKSKLASFAAN